LLQSSTHSQISEIDTRIVAEGLRPKKKQATDSKNLNNISRNNQHQDLPQSANSDIRSSAFAHQCRLDSTKKDFPEVRQFNNPQNLHPGFIPRFNPYTGEPYPYVDPYQTQHPQPYNYDQANTNYSNIRLQNQQPHISQTIYPSYPPSNYNTIVPYYGSNAINPNSHQVPHYPQVRNYNNYLSTQKPNPLPGTPHISRSVTQSTNSNTNLIHEPVEGSENHKIPLPETKTNIGGHQKENTQKSPKSPNRIITEDEDQIGVQLKNNTSTSQIDPLTTPKTTIFHNTHNPQKPFGTIGFSTARKSNNQPSQPTTATRVKIFII
jgi:hypothetical protein